MNSLAGLTDNFSLFARDLNPVTIRAVSGEMETVDVLIMVKQK